MVVKEKLQSGKIFKIQSDFKPSGDQPNAIKELVAGINSSERNQVLLGATGTGKTLAFGLPMMTQLINRTIHSALILTQSPNQSQCEASL